MNFINRFIPRCFYFIVLFFVSANISYARNPEFIVPELLRPRVNFWIDVFTRYDKDQVLIHHRDFPQAVFGVIDFRSQREKLSKRAFEKYKEKIKKQKIRLIEIAMKNLANGKPPRSQLEKLVVEVMEKVPGRSGKYRKAYQEHLVRTQTGIRDKFRDSLKRSGRYMHVLVQIFEKHNLPIELTRLPFIESSFDYRAYSSVGAAGIWQFMPRTGRAHGMRVDRAIDERRDIVKATEGAAKYLKDAHRVLENWGLALTSYNHGVYGVKKKIKKLHTKNLADIIERPSKRVFGFASTNFWPEFLAALEVYENYEFFFPGLVPEAPRYIVGYKLPHTFSFKHVVKTLGVSPDVLKEYNYGISKKVVSGYYNIPKGYVLKLPANFRAKVSSLSKPQKNLLAYSGSGGGYYKVRSGDNLSSIARKHGLSTKDLIRYNKLSSDRIYVGQKLRVGSKSSGSGSGYATYSYSTSVYKVKRGDTLGGIANKFKTTALAIKKLNGLKSSKIYVGQRLKVSSKNKSVSSTKSSSGYSSTSVYRVKKGDTLGGIANKFKISTSTIKKLNGLKSSRIYVGQKLKVKGFISMQTSIYHKVIYGESLWRIAKKYKVSVSSIKKRNNLKSDNLKIGKVLRIK